jgi:RHS repeat-associated protein
VEGQTICEECGARPKSKRVELAMMTGQSLYKAYIPLPAGDVAAYNSSGLAYYHHSDWLGSYRLGSTPSRTVAFDASYGPFGETYAVTGTGVASFTGMTQDTDANLYDFPAREYGIQGRWPSPDPAGLSAADLTDPQTLNRYAYVRNAPLNNLDPTGLKMCAPADCGLIDGGYGPWWGLDSFDYLMALDNPWVGGLNNGGSGIAGILSSILGSLIPVVGSPFIIDNWTTDQNGNVVGDYNGERLCNSNGSNCQDEWWNAATQTWENPCDGPCISGFAQDALGMAGDLAESELQTSIKYMAIIDAGVATAVDISAVESGQLFGTRFAGNNPLFNSNDYFRIGWSYISNSGEYVFRIGGQSLTWLGLNNPHINLWPPSWWGGPPGP